MSLSVQQQGLIHGVTALSLSTPAYAEDHRPLLLADLADVTRGLSCDRPDLAAMMIALDTLRAADTPAKLQPIETRLRWQAYSYHARRLGEARRALTGG